MNQFEQLSYTVAFAVVNERQRLFDMLAAYGVPIDEKHISDEKLTEVVMKLLFSSPKFGQDFLNLVSEKTKYKNAGEDGGFWSGFNASAVSGLLGTGLGFLSSTQISKDQKAAATANAQANLALAQAQSDNNKTQLEIAKLQLEAAKLKPAGNTTLFVILGFFGVVVLGFTVYAVTKSKK